MHLESRALRVLDRDDLACWQSLADHAVEPNPFFEPGFVLPANHALGADQDVQLVRVVDGGRTVAALPMVEGLWRGAVPAIFSWRHNYCFLGTPLVHADADLAQVMATLLTGLSLEAPHRALVWEQLVSDGPVASALRAAASEAGHQAALDVRSERAFLTRRAEETYLDHVSNKHLKELRRQRRRLDEALGGDLTLRDSTADTDAVGRFMRVEASGWKGEAGTAFESDPADARMFEEICSNFRARDRLQMFELAGADGVAAVKCNLLAGDGVFMFKIAFDEDMSRYSPGVQLEIDNLDEFHRGGAGWMDSCAMSDNQMINGLWPERRALASLVLTQRGVLGSAAAAGLKAAWHIRQRRRGITT